MDKEKVELIKAMKSGQIIYFYDNENMNVYNIHSIGVDNNPYYESIPSRSYDFQSIGLARIIAHSFDFHSDLNKVELDPTTMKRIAKYNNEVECKAIVEEIEKKKKELEYINQEINTQSKKLEDIKSFIVKFIKSEKDLESYIEDLKDPYYEGCEYDYDDEDGEE